MKKAFSVLLALALLLSCCPVLTLPAQAATEGLYTYTVTAGAATITACDKSASGALTIPSTLGGYPVTKIGDQAFVSNQNITSVVIPEGVTGIYWQAFAYCPNLASVVLPSSLEILGEGIFTYCTSLTTIQLPQNLQSLGSYVFQDCSSLTSIVIPEGITEISRGAFWCCYALQEVTLPASVTYIDNRAFDSCALQTVYYGGTKLQWQAVAGSGKSALNSYIQYMGVSNDPEIVNNLSFQLQDGGISISGSVTPLSGDVVIPATISGYPVTRIENYAFEENYDITSVTLPDSLTYLGDYAFAYCSSLTSVTLGSGLTQLSSGTFYNCSALRSINLPEGLSSIGYSAFSKCFLLTEITIPQSVTTIEGYAFKFCEGLKIVTFGSKLTTIGEEAFRGCSLLQEVILPDSVQSVGIYAFRSCRNLQKLSIGSKLTQLGTGAFTDCRELNTICVAAGNTGFTTDSQGALLSKDGTRLILAPTGRLSGFTIPQTVTEIGYGVFADCLSLSQITIPQSVTSIGAYAFAGSNLATITLPDSLQRIEEMAFADCTKLTQINIPKNVTEMGYGIFRDAGLQRVTLDEGLQTLGYYCFESCSQLRDVEIPVSLTTIENGAFSYCTKLFYVYYGGTQAQWEQMEIGQYDNEALSKVTIRFNATMPEVPEEPSMEDYLMYTIENGSAVITGYKSMLSGDVTLPSSLGGYTVTEIAYRAFYECYEMTSVTLPDTIVRIEDGAFGDCYGLKTVNLGTNVAHIGTDVFYWCYQLKSITVAAGNQTFSSDSQGALLSKDGTQLILLTGGMTQYTLSNNVTSIREFALSCCNNMERFAVDAQNPSFSADSSGVLFNKDKTTLIKAPTMLSGRYVAPGSVTVVAPEAFARCYALGELVFGSNLTQLGDMAFCNCYNLTLLTLPASLRSIGRSAFEECYPYTIFYTGTQAQWEQVAIHEDGNSYLRYVDLVYDYVAYTPGDLDGVEGVNEDDVIYLLQHLLMPEDFAVDQAVDYDHNNTIDEDDVIYLLQHLLMPDDFPLV